MSGVLHSLLGLYGEGRPDAPNSAPQALMADRGSSAGPGAIGYADARHMQAAVAESHAGKDGVVHQAVNTSGAGTMNGRNQVANQIADFEARTRAIASVGDTRFAGPALLHSAQLALANATRQVNADTASAQQLAAQIVPPAAPPKLRRRAAPPRRRRRRALRSQAVARARSQPRHLGRQVPSDGSAGGNAVSIASAQVGLPYIWGGGGVGGPSGGGFDCSGLTQYAIAQATHNEVVLPRTTYDQIYSGERVHPQDVRPGDLVFPADSFSSRGPEHVQLAAGNGWVIEAPSPGSSVTWSRMPGNAVVVRVL
ncbi:C40 family peptidase [Nocardia colli]|nr:NlpC/P60 family protein [Nocardia colli]